MIETLGTLARVTQIASGCALTGWLCFALARGMLPAGDLNASPSRRAAMLLAMLFVCSGVAVLACQSALITGRDGSLWTPGDWWSVSMQTRFGGVWWTRQLLMLAACLVLGWARPSRSSWSLTAVPAALATAAGAGSGHAAALDPAWPGLLAQVLHVLALALWWGALLPLAGALTRADSAAQFVRVLAGFSRLATVAIAVILGTGVYLAVLHVERWPALFGTRYGHLLLLKLTLIGIVLALAARLRWGWLRRVRSADPGPFNTAAHRLVLIEWLFAAAVIGVAALLAGTPPARHEQVAWPFDFRLAVAFAWAQPGNSPWVIAGCVMLALSLVLIGLRMGLSRSRWLLPAAALSAVSAAGLALPRLCVPAYPDTYRSSEVPYHAISIRNGAALFQQHCTQCHGSGGLGDGPRAKSLSKPPADLSAPHTADHTAGDMYWWLSHGMALGAMPGFAHVLDAESRWDLINYLRAFSSGYQARIIRPQVAPGQPWLGAPDFNYVTQQGDSGSLKELRNRRPALLVFYSWPESAARLRQLAAWRQPADALFVLAMPWQQIQAGPVADIGLPVAVQGGEETATTYALLRRSLRQADIGDRGALPTHMEMLVDRFGYVRARWLPDEYSPWTQDAWLRAQIDALGREPEILPPPDEHIH